MIRPYATTDMSSVIKLLIENTPLYFDPSEQIDLEKYLTVEVEDYFVYVVNGIIIGSGGINYFPHKRIAKISWDMVHPDFHGKGIGSQLIQHRLDHLSNKSDINKIIVRTSQHAYAFYQKMGFKLNDIIEDYWAKDYHLYRLELVK